MDLLVLLAMVLAQSLWRLARSWLPALLAGAGTIVFLPMVALGAAGIVGWRWLTARRHLGRGWLAGLYLAGALQYLVVTLLLGGDPLLRYLDEQLALLELTARALSGQAAWPPWETFGARYAVAMAAVPPGALVAAAAICRWPAIWRAPAVLAVREAQGLDLPWWIARRAARGVRHPPGGWAIGYDRSGGLVAIADAEARHHTIICGAPGTGKTTIVRHLLHGVAGRCAVVLVDCKASTPLRRTVESIPGGVVWTIGGQLRWDALQGDPTSLASKLLAAERYGADAAIYRAAAERYVQWVGTVLDLAAAPRDPAMIAELLAPAALKRAIRQLTLRPGGATPAALDHLARCLNDLGRAEAEGVAGFGCRFGTLIEGAAGASLGTGPQALELEAALRRRQVVLFSLNAAEYGHVAAKIGAWVLLDAMRVAGRLQAEGWGQTQQCYLVVDEFSALGDEGRHLIPLLARGREAGLACVVATQGLADLSRLTLSLPQELAQNTAVKILLRQGSAPDAAAWAKHLGQYEREELSRQLDDYGASLGRNLTRWRADFYVSPDELRTLRTGEAVLSVAPLHRTPRRLTAVRLAHPPPATASWSGSHHGPHGNQGARP
jgi:hypothetical protein